MAMARTTRRRVLAAGGALAALSPWLAHGARASTPHPFADFFAEPRTRAVVLSPSGARIGVLTQLGTKDAPRGVIDVLDAADPEGPRRRVELGKVKVEALEWANDKRLLLRVATEQMVSTGRASAGSSYIKGRDVKRVSRRILSIDPDTQHTVAMFEDQRQRMRHSWNLAYVIDLLPREPDHVLMAAWEADGVLALHKVDINTGRSERVERGASSTIGWQTHDGVAVMRRDINPRATVETLYARAPGETQWKFVRRNRIVDRPDFAWVGGGSRPGSILVRARQDDENVESVREMDLHTLAFGPPLFTRPDRDVFYGLLGAGEQLVGAAYYGDRLEYEFNDPELGAHHRAMNRFFDDDVDVHLTQVSNDRNRFIIRADGPREPGAWFLYDRTARSMTHLGSSRALEMERLGACDLIRIKARDGGEFEAYLTAPVGRAPGPLVVIPHGGPEVRDRRGFDRQAQVLAAQGWWVLQPNFRGSGGYGRAFARQGWRGWNGRMQEDVEDAVAQVVRDKGLDGGRVAIMGASYGGYAALMGAVRRPDLYKAAIAICGVADLPDMLTWERREDDTPTKEVYEFWVKRIGDPTADAEMLRAASPRRRADEIVCPVILVHGVDDKIVPVSQSRAMNSALRAAGKSVDYVEVPEAGHGDWDDEVEQGLMTRYVALLRQAFA